MSLFLARLLSHACTPRGDRTPDRLLKRELLYLAELWAQDATHYSYKPLFHISGIHSFVSHNNFPFLPGNRSLFY